MSQARREQAEKPGTLGSLCRPNFHPRGAAAVSPLGAQGLGDVRPGKGPKLWILHLSRRLTLFYPVLRDRGICKEGQTFTVPSWPPRLTQSPTGSSIS